MPNKTGTEREQRRHVGKAWANRGSSRDLEQYVLNGEAGRQEIKPIEEQDWKAILCSPVTLCSFYNRENKS